MLLKCELLTCLIEDQVLIQVLDLPKVKKMVNTGHNVKEFKKLMKSFYAFVVVTLRLNFVRGKIEKRLRPGYEIYYFKIDSSIFIEKFLEILRN